MQIGSKHRLKMLLGTLSAPNRGQVGSRMLQVRKPTTPKSTFWAENVSPGADCSSGRPEMLAVEAIIFVHETG